MKQPFRIAMLECDTPLPKTKANYKGGYGNVFKALLRAGAKALNQEKEEEVVPEDERGLVMSCWDVVEKQEYPKADDVDAVLITGSKYNSFDNDEWIIKLVDYTKDLLKNQSRIRIIGVCFGHQIIGRALDVGVGRNEKDWEVSVSLIKLTDKGQELFGGKDIMSLQQMHRDVVYDCPEDVEALGSSPICKVQGMYSPRRLISVQGHPEFNEEIVQEILDTRKDQGTIGHELYNDAVERVGHHHDGVLVAKAFVQFLMEE